MRTQRKSQRGSHKTKLAKSYRTALGLVLHANDARLGYNKFSDVGVRDLADSLRVNIFLQSLRFV